MAASPDVELPDTAEAVLALVDKLGPAEVTTYGDLANRVGTGPRQVGAIMRRYGHLTEWWRVVRADGSSHDPARSVPFRPVLGRGGAEARWD